MDVFTVLGDPVRRRILELLADGPLASGAVTATIHSEFGISQPAVSQHLGVLRDNGFATVQVAGARRLYTVNLSALAEVDQWLNRFRGFWTQRLDAFATELARGRRTAREGPTAAGSARVPPADDATGPDATSRAAKGQRGKRQSTTERKESA